MTLMPPEEWPQVSSNLKYTFLDDSREPVYATTAEQHALDHPDHVVVVASPGYSYDWDDVRYRTIMLTCTGNQSSVTGRRGCNWQRSLEMPGTPW